MANANFYDDVLKPLVDGFRQTEVGDVNSGGIPAGASKTVDVTFYAAFRETPHVVVGLMTSGTTGKLGSVSVAVSDITKTGCKIRFFNASDSSLSPAAHYIAAGRRHTAIIE